MSWLQIAGVVVFLAAAAALVVWRQRAVALAGESRVFLGEVVEEVRKITWPSRAELRQLTIVILVFVTVVAVIIGAMDILLQLLVVRLPGGLT